MSNYETTVRELTLMLLYLTSWTEKEFGTEWRRSWKGYPFDTLDELTEQDHIRGSKRSKSVQVTDEGVKQAKELLARYGISEDWERTYVLCEGLPTPRTTREQYLPKTSPKYH